VSLLSTFSAFDGNVRLAPEHPSVSMTIGMVESIGWENGSSPKCTFDGNTSERTDSAAIQPEKHDFPTLNKCDFGSSDNLSILAFLKHESSKTSTEGGMQSDFNEH
jgi:hypothetical protein